MLVQARPDRLLLVRQHDHALASGQLAAAWRGTGGGGARPSFRTVLATALHDLAWRELDGEPRWNPDTGRPFSFHEHPLEEKLAAYGRGLDRMEEVSPWVGLAGSLHYASFVDQRGQRGRAGEFLEAERERQRRLAGRLRARAAGDVDPVGRVRRELGWLKLFDGLSIRLCLAPPPVPDASLPAWMDREAPLEAPDGTRLRLAWEEPGRVRVHPWPFDADVELELPVRELPAARYPDAAALRRAWESAGERSWRLVLSAPDRETSSAIPSES